MKGHLFPFYYPDKLVPSRNTLPMIPVMVNSLSLSPVLLPYCKTCTKGMLKILSNTCGSGTGEGPREILCGDLGKMVPGKGGGGYEDGRDMWGFKEAIV